MTSEELLDLIAITGNFPLRGQHNLQNATAAYHVCRALGVSHDDIIKGMKTFPGLPHRMEIVGYIDRIDYAKP